jgi:hypothetical protein
MNTAANSNADAGRLDASSFFARSPFRSAYFVADTLLLFLDLCMCGVILVRHGHAFSPSGIAYLLLGAVALFLPWWGALRLHAALFLLAHSDPKPEPGSLLNLCLGHFANWIHYGLLCTYALGSFVFGAIIEFFIRTGG